MRSQLSTLNGLSFLQEKILIIIKVDEMNENFIMHAYLILFPFPTPKSQVSTAEKNHDITVQKERKKYKRITLKPV